MTFTLADRPAPDGGVLAWEVEAATWEEAMAVYHVRMGFEPYKPQGEPRACPVHGEDYVVYPEESGDCWKCLEDRSAAKAAEDAGRWAATMAKDMVAAGEAEYGGLVVHNPPSEEELDDGCPCLRIGPCRPTCTCVCGAMSGGCDRCAKYGSREQQQAAARFIAEAVGAARSPRAPTI